MTPFKNVFNDLSIASPKTKYIKLNTKTRNIFCHLNEYLMTFFIHFDRGDKKTEGKKKYSLLKCIQKSNFMKNKTKKDLVQDRELEPI